LIAALVQFNGIIESGDVFWCQSRDRTTYIFNFLLIHLQLCPLPKRYNQSRVFDSSAGLLFLFLRDCIKDFFEPRPFFPFERNFIDPLPTLVGCHALLKHLSEPTQVNPLEWHETSKPS
jgi:hypothetical protein